MKNQSAVSTVSAQTDRFLAGCGVFVFSVALIWALFFVPMNMDEAGIYHVLACLNYPFSPWQSFRDSCVEQHVLTLPIFGIDVIQPERYTGLLHSILYAPVYFLFHNPYAQYGFNLCFFGGFAYLLSRQMRKPLLGLALILSFFPFVFQFVHDTGPINFAILAFPLCILLVRKVLGTPSPLAYGWAAVLALLILAAVEDKPFFLYLMPMLGFFVLALAFDREDKDEILAALKKARGPLFFAAAIAVSGLCVLFFSVTHAHGFYISWLMDITNRETLMVPWIYVFADFMLYWPGYAHYYYSLHDDALDVNLFMLVTAVFIIGTVVVAVQGKSHFSGCGRRFACLGLSFAVTAAIFAFAGNTWAGHHFIFLWVPLIVLFADLLAALAPGWRMGLAAVFFVLNLASIVSLTQETLQIPDSADREAIFHYFSDDARASQALVNFSSWGEYYIQALYGPKDQLVTYTQPFAGETFRTLSLSPQDAGKLLDTAQKTGRRVYNVCYGQTCNKASLEVVFGGRTAVVEEVLPGLADWHVFAVTPSALRKSGS